ncbi:MBL fold metallo-hydrolase [Margalitia sp. FSL K6-0131]|uniref:MBL fold metallo-hydrolase n=1 Tax=Margalitia sp. FSL K6-0131 TaxID=2954604 RepID=UPI0030F77F0C
MDLINNGMVLVGKEFNLKDDDRIVQNDDVIRMGNIDIQIIHSPGHTNGSMCLKLDKWLFTGDTLFKDKNPGIDKKTGNGDLLKLSIQKILDHSSENTILCPGHGEITHLGYLKNKLYV